jgi:hypothetical protein
VANLRKFFHQSVAAAFFSPSRIRREKASSCRKKNRANSAATSLPQDSRMHLMFGAARFLATRLKRLSRLRISHHTARHSRRAASPHAAQVLQATMEFRRDEAARLAMRLKHLKRRTFSSCPRAARAWLAFGLPQRA